MVVHAAHYCSSLITESLDVLCYVSDDMGVSKIRGIPKSSILIGFSIINHPFYFGGFPPIFGIYVFPFGKKGTFPGSHSLVYLDLLV